MAQARLGRLDDAEKSLRKALEINPQNAGVNFNLGLLLAERNRVGEAETSLRQALKSDPEFAEAAYNLGVLLGGQEDPEAVSWCRKAYQLRPRNDRYGYTLAYHLVKSGSPDEAIKVLESVIALIPPDPSAYLLLAELRQSKGQEAMAAEVFLKAAGNNKLDGQQRAWFRSRSQGQ
jgi:tetratricopeptide (TPR) repeat protein